MSAMYATGDSPIIQRHADGRGISVSFDGETFVNFKTLNNYRSHRDAMDREEACYETAAWERFGQARDERAALAGGDG